jgi:hypothetical protein
MRTKKRTLRLIACAAAAITSVAVTVTISTPPAAAQTTASPTFTIGGVPGWVGSPWGNPSPTFSFWDATNGKPVVSLTNNWSGAWFQAPKPITATHIQAFLQGQFSTYIGVKLTDGQFKWAATDAFVAASGASFNGGAPTLGLVPIAEIFGLSTRPMSIQAIAYMRDGTASIPARFAFDAITNPTATDGLNVELARSTTDFSTSVHTTPWSCVTISGTAVATTCDWGGFGIERRSRDWSFQRTFPASTFLCTMYTSNDAATEAVFGNGGAVLTIDRTAVPLVLGKNLVRFDAESSFRFTVPIPAGTKQLGLVFAKPVKFRYDSDFNCKITSP